MRCADGGWQSLMGCRIWDVFICLQIRIAQCQMGDSMHRSVKVYSQLFFFFQYRLEASGISIKLGDQGLFLPVLMLVGKQLVICITEKTYKDSGSRMVFFAFGGENIFFTFLSFSLFLFTLPSCFWWLGERKLHMETEDLSFEFFPCAAASAPFPLAFPMCCISICRCLCLCLWCQCHSSCGSQILFYCIVLTNMFPVFCLFCCSSRFQSLER